MVGSKVAREAVKDTLFFSQKGFTLTCMLSMLCIASESPAYLFPLLHLFSTGQPKRCI